METKRLVMFKCLLYAAWLSIEWTGQELVLTNTQRTSNQLGGKTDIHTVTERRQLVTPTIARL